MLSKLASTIPLFAMATTITAAPVKDDDDWHFASVNTFPEIQVPQQLTATATYRLGRVYVTFIKRGSALNAMTIVIATSRRNVITRKWVLGLARTLRVQVHQTEGLVLCNLALVPVLAVDEVARAIWGKDDSPFFGTMPKGIVSFNFASFELVYE